MSEKYKKKGFNRILTKLFNMLAELFTKHIVVNAFIYYDKGKILSRNWGDDINYFFLKRLFRREIVSYDYSSLSHRLKRDNYLMIGSTLTLLCNSESIVWGAGVIDATAELPARPKKVLAVRGPLTRKYLLERGIQCPEVYGDPALLIPYVYSPKIEKKYKLGIIPHYSDYDSPALDKFRDNNEIKFIKMEGYEKWTDVIDNILSCERIVSSSLHGLIIAEAFGIPNLWAEIKGELLGGHFKFHDFFCSIERDREAPFVIDKTTTYDLLSDAVAKWQPGKIDIKPLIESAPFKIYIK